jgi:hypothetical protein
LLDSSKLKEFADDSFNFDENVGKFIQMGRKTLIMNNLFFSYRVFKRLELNTYINLGLFGKWLS